MGGWVCWMLFGVGNGGREKRQQEEDGRQTDGPEEERTKSSMEREGKNGNKRKIGDRRTDRRKSSEVPSSEGACAMAYSR